MRSGPVREQWLFSSTEQRIEPLLAHTHTHNFVASSLHHYSHTHTFFVASSLHQYDVRTVAVQQHRAAH